MATYSLLGSQALTVDATAGGVSLTFPSGVVYYAEMQLMDANEGFALDAPIRFTTDSSITVTAAGAEASKRLEVGGVLEIWGRGELANFRAIRVGSNSAHLKIDYFGTV